MVSSHQMEKKIWFTKFLLSRVWSILILLSQYTFSTAWIYDFSDYSITFNESASNKHVQFYLFVMRSSFHIFRGKSTGYQKSWKAGKPHPWKIDEY